MSSSYWLIVECVAISPGYKTCTAHARVIGVVDADYVVRPDWLKLLVGHFDTISADETSMAGNRFYTALADPDAWMRISAEFMSLAQYKEYVGDTTSTAEESLAGSGSTTPSEGLTAAALTTVPVAAGSMPQVTT